MAPRMGTAALFAQRSRGVESACPCHPPHARLQAVASHSVYIRGRTSGVPCLRRRPPRRCSTSSLRSSKVELRPAIPAAGGGGHAATLCHPFTRDRSNRLLQARRSHGRFMELLCLSRVLPPLHHLQCHDGGKQQRSSPWRRDPAPDALLTAAQHARLEDRFRGAGSCQAVADCEAAHPGEQPKQQGCNPHPLLWPPQQRRPAHAGASALCAGGLQGSPRACTAGQN